jgi:hypothetical protein
MLITAINNFAKEGAGDYNLRVKRFGSKLFGWVVLLVVIFLLLSNYNFKARRSFIKSS